jgi:hypothetical protein
MVIVVSIKGGLPADAGSRLLYSAVNEAEMRLKFALWSSSGDRARRDAVAGAIADAVMFHMEADVNEHVVPRSSLTLFCDSDPQTCVDERVGLGEVLDLTFWSWLHGAKVCSGAPGRGCLLVVMNFECRS